jgi:hypothetical protein
MTTRRSSEEIELLDTHAGSKTVGWITPKLKARTQSFFLSSSLDRRNKPGLALELDPRTYGI